MATASQLQPNMKVWLTDGPFKGKEGFVLGPTDPSNPSKIITARGDEPGQRRKVMIAVHGLHTEDDSPFETWYLPRMLDIEPPMPQSIDQVLRQQPRMAKAALTGAEASAVLSAKYEPITDPMDPVLDRFRPDPEIVNKYINRQVAGGFLDTEYLLDLRDRRDSNGYSPNVGLVGETQSGKTMLVRVLAVLAAQRDGLPKPYPVFTLNGSSGVTGYDIFGQTTAVIIDGQEVLVWMDGLVSLAARVGGILYLDEWNAVSPAQAIALHPILDDTRRFTNTQKAVPNGHGGFMPEEVKVNPNLWCIVTINPSYKGTQTMAEASSNRFRWLPWDYDQETERALVPSTTIRLMGEALREAKLRKAISMPIGTSVLQRFNDDCAEYGAENALWAFLGIFSPVERERVTDILDEAGMADLLKQEYPTPETTASGGISAHAMIVSDPGD
jgi:hypothetical protein